MKDLGLFFVTGASGLLGANLVLHLRQLGQNVIALYHKHRFIAPKVESLQADLTDRQLVNGLLQRFRPNWVIHCAAITNVDWCEEHPAAAYRVNVEASCNLAAAAARIGAGMVYISTDSVFDGRIGDYSEKNRPSPINVYAKSKLAGEKAVQEQLPSCLIVRTNIYGWNMQEKQSLAEWMISQLELGRFVPAFYDVIFTPVLVNDLSKILFEMITRRLMGLYHVGSSQAYSKYEFALEVADVFDLNKELIKPISIDDSALQALRPKNTSLKTDKVAQVLRIPMPTVRSGLQHLKLRRDSGWVTKLKTFGGD